MIEKDNIQDLFSKAFEQHQSAVRPDLWAGVQSKMAAAGMASAGSAAAVKGVSALTKWIIGTAAVTTLGVGTFIVYPSNDSKKEQKQPTTQVANNKEVIPSEEIVQKNPQIQTKQTNTTTNRVEKTPLSESLEEVTHYLDYLAPLSGDQQHKTDSFSEQNAGEVGSTVTETPNAGTNVIVDDDEIKKETPADVKTETKPVLEAKVLVFPNVFSPNVLDGQNDFYEIEAEHLQQFKVMFLDMKNSKVVFESTDVHFKWDGRYNGDILPVGSYVCILSYVDEKGKRQQKSQQVEIR